MATEFAQVHNHMVLRDADNTWRWYDAWGDRVVKYFMNTAACPTDNTTGMPVEFVNTLVGASTFAHTDVAGGAVLLTAEAADNDGVKLQLGDELGGAGENVDFSLRYPCYFHVRLQIDDVSQTDFLAGFCVTDTACLDAVTDGMYFRSIDETGVVNFVLEQNSLETVTAVATMTDAADIDLEFLATIADTDVYFPNDELLRLTFEFLQGEIAAHTCTLKRLGFIQIQEA
jgi:hypothetical protein